MKKLFQKIKDWFAGNANVTNKEELNFDEEAEFEKEDVENTPFQVIRVKGQWYVMMSKYRLNEIPHKSKQEAIADAHVINWNRISQVISGIMEAYRETDYLKQRAKEIEIDELTK